MTQPQPAKSSSGVWEGVCDGETWRIEVEPDCMAESEPFTVSVWVSEENWTQNPKASVEGAFLSAEQAREVAATLLRAADSVDANNQRVAKWRATRG